MKGVLPLLPHLTPGSTFVEPCAGDGRLVRHLEAHGHHCTLRCDIAPEVKGIAKMDARYLLPAHVAGADYIITNPPWTRELLHPMIIRFSFLKPTWLLFDADWAHTGQTRPLLQRLRKVVSVGRLRWIDETTMDGKDNAAWYLFDRPRDLTEHPTQFVGRMA